MVMLDTEIIIGKAKLNDHFLYPIIISNITVSIETAIVCNKTCEAILTFFLMAYKTVTQTYTIPIITIADHLKFGEVNSFIKIDIRQISIETSNNIFIITLLFFIFTIFGYNIYTPLPSI